MLKYVYIIGASLVAALAIAVIFNITREMDTDILGRHRPDAERRLAQICREIRRELPYVGKHPGGKHDITDLDKTNIIKEAVFETGNTQGDLSLFSFRFRSKKETPVWAAVNPDTGLWLNEAEGKDQIAAYWPYIISGKYTGITNYIGITFGGKYVNLTNLPIWRPIDLIAIESRFKKLL